MYNDKEEVAKVWTQVRQYNNKKRTHQIVDVHPVLAEEARRKAGLLEGNRRAVEKRQKIEQEQKTHNTYLMAVGK